MKYFVRTTNERQLDASYNQIEYEALVDLNHQPVESFINQLEEISKYDSVLLEDDLVLCKDFKTRIENVIEQYHDSIINFFTQPNIYFKTRRSYVFNYNQCTYYPKGLGKQLAKIMREIDLKAGYDTLLHIALKKLNITHIQYRPCLVQHIDKKSLITNRCKSYSRQTIYFIDYLDELGIPYDEANTKDVKQKLEELRIKQINEKFTKEQLKG